MNCALRKIAFLILAAVGLPVLASENPLPKKGGCLALTLSEVGRIKAANNYSYNATRSIDELADSGVRFLGNLPEQSSVLDVGSGFGVYANELALQGHRVTTINLQDFYADRLLPQIDRLSSANVNRSKLTQIYEEVDRVGVPFRIEVSPPGPSLGTVRAEPGATDGYLNSLRVAVRQINERRRALQEQGNLKALVGSAQEKLSKVPDNSMDLILDVFGATTYSDYRVLLISSYWKKLKVGGKISINIGLINDTVDGLPLATYLRRRFPGSVKLTGSRQKEMRIEITKIEGEDLGDLGSLVERISGEQKDVKIRPEVPLDTYRVRE